MPNPAVVVNNLSTLNGVEVAPSASITIQLSDLTGVSSWTCRVVGTDDQQSAATINAGIVINNVTRTATLTMPATARGSALLFESKVNNGRDLNGQLQSSYTTRFAIFAIGTSGLRLVALNQKTEGNAEFGWIEDLNHLLANNGPVADVQVMTYDITTVTDTDAQEILKQITLALTALGLFDDDGVTYP